MNIDSIKILVIKTAGRTGLLLGKYSPEILMGVGVVGIVVSTVLACKATLKVDEVVEESKEVLAKIHDGRTNFSLEKYSEMDYKQDLLTAYLKTGFNFVKLYGPSVTLSALSIGCMLSSHGIMKRRNLALVAAYQIIDEAFKKYRARVVEDHGETTDFKYIHGIRSEEITTTVVAEDGKKTKVKSEVLTLDMMANASPYARYFGPEVRDEDGKIIRPANIRFRGNRIDDEYFLLLQQNYANNKLCAVGHVFLNDVYEMLGMPHTEAGSVVGWILDEYEGRGFKDGYIDFNIHNLFNNPNPEYKRFGEDGYLVDFNVDGLIYNLLPR